MKREKLIKFFEHMSNAGYLKDDYATESHMFRAVDNFLVSIGELKAYGRKTEKEKYTLSEIEQAFANTSGRKSNSGHPEIDLIFNNNKLTSTEIDMIINKLKSLKY